MKKTVLCLMMLAAAVFAASAWADEGMEKSSAGSGDYVENMKHDLVRGAKNVIGAPLEIPITIQEYHEKSGRPVIRHIFGLVDGTFRTLVRFGSGAWDFAAAFLPDHQAGMPVDPETLF